MVKLSPPRASSSGPSAARLTLRLAGGEIHAELTRVAAWTQQQGDAISAFGEWLRNYPTPSEIKPRCQQLLDRLR